MKVNPRSGPNIPPRPNPQRELITGSENTASVAGRVFVSKRHPSSGSPLLGRVSVRENAGKGYLVARHTLKGSTGKVFGHRMTEKPKRRSH